MSPADLQSGRFPATGEKLGVIVVDHGSRRDESNSMLPRVVELFQQLSGYPIVEPAHMELAAPSIAESFTACVRRGATTVVIFPYFLLPGRHWDQDIPALAAAAARQHPGVRYLVTAPLGLHPLMARIMQDRIEHCLEQAGGMAEPCDVCAASPCRLKSGA